MSRKNWIKDAVKSCTFDNISVKKNYWISENIIKLIDQRGENRNSNMQEEEKRQAVKHLNKQIKHT